MRNSSKFLFLFLCVVVALEKLEARPSAPLPETIYDGGVISAETLARGGTIASNHGTHASGSENPASLSSGLTNSMYTTILFSPSSSLATDTLDSNDPLRNRTLQYLSIGASKGVLFYEPLSRYHERQILDVSSPLTNYRDVEYSANALGFAGVDNFGQGGQVGVSLAYIWSNLVTEEKRTGSPDVLRTDNLNGVRMNIGMRYPTGPTMWGISIQNGPGFLWGQRFRHEMLPIKIRAGNTWRIQNGLLLSIDGEHRYYKEGSINRDYVYIGLESFVSDSFALRFGTFGQQIDKSDRRHVTAGGTITTKTKSTLSYAYEVFKLDNEKVKRSVISFQFPISTPDK